MTKASMDNKRALELRGGVDITAVDVDVIVQQCNCLTRNSHGLSSTISHKLNVNIYAGRTPVSSNRQNLSASVDRGDPGTCVLVKTALVDTQSPRYVACLLAQFAPGKPGYYYKDVTRVHGLKDDAVERLAWFRASLRDFEEQIRDLGVRSIAFPKYIGCGLAGGNYEAYGLAISEFIDRMPPFVSVYILVP